MTREEAIEMLNNVREYTDDEAIDMAIEALSERTGEWIVVCDSEGEGDNLYRCSKCGCEYGCQEYDKPNFCLNCGARMKGGGEK